MTDTGKHRDPELLNRLHEMQQSPYYATACQTLVKAEMLIVKLEVEVERLKARNADLEAKVEQQRFILASGAAPKGNEMLTEFLAAAKRDGVTHLTDPSAQAAPKGEQA